MNKSIAIIVAAILSNACVDFTDVSSISTSTNSTSSPVVATVSPVINDAGSDSKIEDVVVDSDYCWTATPTVMVSDTTKPIPTLTNTGSSRVTGYYVNQANLPAGKIAFELWSNQSITVSDTAPAHHLRVVYTGSLFADKDATCLDKSNLVKYFIYPSQ